MNVPSILQRRRELRWLAPAGVVCVAALAATGAFSASASPEAGLPRTTPAALIAAVREAPAVTGFAGTIVTHLDLGLPDLPAIGNAGDGTSFTSLLSGSHTLEVWYGGVDKQRIALLGTTDETDLFRDGSDVWQYSSAGHSAVHLQLPAHHATHESTPVPISGSPASMTPSALASRAIAAIDPSTRVTVDSNRTVADRAAYDLVLTPRTTATKVGSVHIAVDGATKLPLAVQVYPRGSKTPALDVAYTGIRFGHQADRNFQFTPPGHTAVRDITPGRHAAEPSTPAGADHAPRVTGSDWTTVVALQPGTDGLKSLTQHGVLDALTPVSGTWGSGRLLDSSLLSVLVTSDGRVYAGAVAPSDLYAAAAQK